MLKIVQFSDILNIEGKANCVNYALILNCSFRLRLDSHLQNDHLRLGTAERGQY